MFRYIRPATPAEAQYAQDVDQLRRDLEAVIQEAKDALAELDRGIIPWSAFKTSAILHRANDVHVLQHRLDALRVLIGTDQLSLAFATRTAAQNNDLEIPEDEA